MKYLLALATVVGLLLLVNSTASAGAKDGKIRWSTNKDIQNGKAPIKVPAATAADKPGMVELKVVYVANKLAEFFVIGDGDTDIDVVVFDAKGNKVAEDVDPSDYGSDLCMCRWTPREEQEYTIRIFNHGKVYNLCQAGTN